MASVNGGRRLGPERWTPMMGSHGRADLVDTSGMEQGPHATVATWLITAPGYSPLWDQYRLTVVHLRPGPGLPEPKIAREGASHEFVLAAVDPTGKGRYTTRDYAEAGCPVLHPLNVVHQVIGITDEQAAELARLTARAVVEGLLLPEPQGIVGARETWIATFDNTAEHMRTGGHGGVHVEPGSEQWCELHWLPIRDDARYNGIAAAIALIEQVMNDHRFMRMCGGDPETGKPADLAMANAKLAEIAPLCCWIGEERMAEVYRAARDAGPQEPADA